MRGNEARRATGKARRNGQRLLHSVFAKAGETPRKRSPGIASSLMLCQPLNVKNKKGGWGRQDGAFLILLFVSESRGLWAITSGTASSGFPTVPAVWKIEPPLLRFLVRCNARPVSRPSPPCSRIQTVACLDSNRPPCPACLRSIPPFEVPSSPDFLKSTNRNVILPL